RLPASHTQRRAEQSAAWAVDHTSEGGAGSTVDGRANGRPPLRGPERPGEEGVEPPGGDGFDDRSELRVFLKHGLGDFFITAGPGVWIFVLDLAAELCERERVG